MLQRISGPSSQITFRIASEYEKVFLVVTIFLQNDLKQTEWARQRGGAVQGIRQSYRF